MWFDLSFAFYEHGVRVIAPVWVSIAANNCSGTLLGRASLIQELLIIFHYSWFPAAVLYLFNGLKWNGSMETDNKALDSLVAFDFIAQLSRNADVSHSIMYLKTCNKWINEVFRRIAYFGAVSRAALLHLRISESVTIDPTLWKCDGRCDGGGKKTFVTNELC